MKIALLIAAAVLIVGCEDRFGADAFSGLPLPSPRVSQQEASQVSQQEAPRQIKKSPRLTKFFDCQPFPEELIGMTIAAVMEKCDRENAYATRTLATADGAVTAFMFDYFKGERGGGYSPTFYVIVRNGIVVRAAN